MERPLSIDPEVRRAETLPASFYRSQASYDALREGAFARSWQFVGHEGLAKVPGMVHPFILLPGLLDEPLMLVRDRDDKLRCLSNVCTHRGAQVCAGAGVQNSLRCRYHGRRFGLDGRFLSMPEFDEAEGFPRPEDDLPVVEHSVWKGLTFVRLQPAAPSLAEALSEVDRLCGWLPVEQFLPDAAGVQNFMMRAHWSLYIDNYLEGFHIPYIHAALNEALDYGSYRTELFDGGNLQVGAAADDEEAFDLPVGHPHHGQRIGAYYFWLFPNTMLNFYPWGLSVNVVQPLGLDRTKVTFLPYVWDESKRGQGAGAALDRVEREDEAVVEEVQVGVRSRLYRAGRYSPARENGVHQFHRLIAEALA
jgi:choline monooxygenase